MAKRTKPKDVSPELFSGPVRRSPHRTLFLPRYLSEEAAKVSFKGTHQDAAYAAVCKWADLESNGHLAKYIETSVDGTFLTEIFGPLGYALKTTHPDDYQLSIKYAVPGIGAADGALGAFPKAASPVAVIELKDAGKDLDRDKASGRTAVQQVWDYLSGLPDCPWAIVSNLSTIRLYHRNRTPRAYEEFTLQDFRRRDRFNEFYYLFEKGGLLHKGLAKNTRAALLLEKTVTLEKEVGDDLYEEYQRWRNELIAHLNRTLGKPLDTAIRVAQKLLDRVIFIAFCEKRGLLPLNSLARAESQVAPFQRVTNPRWHNLLGLFKQMDAGGPDVELEHGFNGGLFAKDADIDDLQLDDNWARAFTGFGRWDFKDEVNVDVLGHLFERSITELEKLRVGGLYALTQGAASANGQSANGSNTSTDDASPMPKSPQRKRLGIYYTPPAFTGLLVDRTVDTLARERYESLARAHKVDPDTGKNKAGESAAAYWHDCIASLRDLKIVDPACGSGAFLIRAYESLESHYHWATQGLINAKGVSAADLNGFADHIPDWILADNLYGVDLSEQAVEITQLALWIRSARPNRTLSDLSKNVVCGNSLVSDKSVHVRAIDWCQTFPAVFSRPGDKSGFDCVIGNPPWERAKVQDREFFSLTDPETAEAVNASDRKKRIALMPKANPDLHAAYETARDQAQRMLDYARQSGRYPLTGKGDVNTYMLFAELARTLVAPRGIAGLLVPSGIATDDTTKEFFAELMDSKALVSLYDFENREKIFADVDGRFKFSALVFGGAARQTDHADFVFFAHAVEEVAPHNKRRHIALTAADMALLNPNTRTCPIFRSRRDADLTKAIYRRVPILIDQNRKQGGNPWELKFLRMFDQTNDAKHFFDGAHWKKDGYKLVGNRFVKGKKTATPLYEAKMVQAFDHRAASVLIDEDNWVRQGQKAETNVVQHANPEYAVLPRWWVDEPTVDKSLAGQPGDQPWLLGFKDITSPTNERTMIASFIPRAAVTNKFVLILTGAPARRTACLLANLNSFVFDYVTRQKIGGITLNFFIVEQLPTLPPGIYGDKCPWSKRETLEHWISERVLRLTCTSDDMKSLADAASFKGSRGDGVHLWKDPERAQLRAELDAAFFRLYAIEREDVEYILSTFAKTGDRTETGLSGDQSPWASGGAAGLVLKAYDDLAFG